MKGWGDLKWRAREWHKVLLTRANGRHDAFSLLEAAEEITGIGRSPLPATDPLLMGGDAFYDPSQSHIFYNEDIKPELVVFCQMHEYAHSQLHAESTPCLPEDFDPEASEEDVQLGVARVAAYSPHERTEREANIFAREVLLPSDKVRSWYLEEGKNGEEIANMIGVPSGMVFHQLSFSLLVSDLLKERDDQTVVMNPPPPDYSQRLVAEWTNGPLLVEAGPGTGKTKTLIERTKFLLDNGVQPSSILALTFSNKAAEEMRERISIVAPEAAHQIWMGTFHAFGLEFLQKYGCFVGLSPEFRILDTVDAIILLEDSLSSLKLEYYKNLYDPTLNFPHILAAISRAKDEFVGPEKYLYLAENMRAQARSENDIEAAEKAIEVAEIYKFYQKTIESESLVDFGDLIFRTICLIREHPKIRDEICQKYEHILVDEYQDVNRASGILLREIVGASKGLWVVGDSRQSIYRFRGASPENVKHFQKDFPDAQTKPLEINYRSRPAVINVFSKLVPFMSSSNRMSFKPWQSKRDNEKGKAVLVVGEDVDAEVEFIAREVERQKNNGVRYRDQAVLCRTHSVMAHIAAKLEYRGIPVLYLGDIFEREEIKNLLSLLSLTVKGTGIGLIRVGRFPEYNIPLPDILTLIRVSRESNKGFLETLSHTQNLPEISLGGRKGIALLLLHLKNIGFTTNAWDVFSQYLFNRSNFLQPYLKDTSLSGQQKRLAIFQFLQFAHDQINRPRAHNIDPKRAFLNYIRRLKIQGDDATLRQVPDWADGFDAVRILTVHASKGLQFPVVFIPGVSKGFFPLRERSNICPPPSGMILGDINVDGHGEEEECLFFVALSRCEDYLFVSRPATRGWKKSNPPDMLTEVSGSFTEVINFDQIPGIFQVKEEKDFRNFSTAINLPTLFDVRELDRYLKCPREYLYGVVLGLSGKRENTGYVQFHRCIYTAIRWIGEERSQGRVISETDVIEKLHEIWRESGPTEHAYEVVYFNSAKTMVSNEIRRQSCGIKKLPSPTWEVVLENGSVKIVPDSFEEHPKEGFQVLRYRTGKPTNNEIKDNNIYAIYLDAAEKALGGNSKVGVLYLSNGQIREVSLDRKMRNTRLARYDKAISGIKNISFPAQINDRICPRCPFYFICPSAEDI